MPEFDGDQHAAAFQIRMKLSSVEADLCATESPNHGDTGWLPPLEAKCNWSPDRRCHLVPDEGDVTSPWEFKLSNDPGTQHWKNALGADLARSLEAAGNFHMRLSWKKNLDACLVVFEAWSDTDNDGYFHAEVGAVLRDSTGDILKSTKALVSQRPGKPGRLPDDHRHARTSASNDTRHLPPGF